MTQLNNQKRKKKQDDGEITMTSLFFANFPK